MQRLLLVLLVINVISGCEDAQRNHKTTTSNDYGNPTAITPVTATNLDEQSKNEADPHSQAATLEPNSPEGVFNTVIEANTKADYGALWRLCTETRQSLFLNAVAFQAFGSHQNFETMQKDAEAIGGTSGTVYKMLDTLDRNFSNALKKHGISFGQLAEIMKDVTEENFNDIALNTERGNTLRQMVKDDSALFTDLCVAAEAPGFFGPRSVHGLDAVKITGDTATAVMSTDTFGEVTESLVSFKRNDGQWKMHTQELASLQSAN